MARKILNNLETYGVIRNKINDNFTDLYDNKSDENHTHTELHTHDNKNVLDSISQNDIIKWNSGSGGSGDGTTIDDDNSSLFTTYSSSKIDNELNKKVDKEEGKSLVSDEEIIRLASVDNYDDTSIQTHINNSNVHVTDEDKDRWNNKSDFSGSYNDLIDKPLLKDGKSLEYNWYDTQLGIRVEGEENYTYVDLKGDQGIQGEQGDQGIQGEKGEDGISPTVTVNTNTGATYTLDITDANGTITTPNLKGADGTGAGDMTSSVYDPQGKAIDIFNYVDQKAGSSTAIDTSYDNTSSGLIATNTQDAIDELQQESVFLANEVERLDTDKIDSSEKGIAEGVATLGVDGKVPSEQLPPISSSASDITYDNAESGLQATDTQGAIDEVNSQLAEIAKYPSLKSNGNVLEIKTFENFPIKVNILSENQAEKIIISGKNLFNKTAPLESSLYINEPNMQMQFSKITNYGTIYIPILGGLTYTISKTIGESFRIGTAQVPPSLNSPITKTVADHQSDHITITTAVTDNYLIIVYYADTLDTTSTKQELRDSIQIEIGAEKTNFENHMGYLIETVNIVGGEGNLVVSAFSGVTIVASTIDLDVSYVANIENVFDRLDTIESKIKPELFTRSFEGKTWLFIGDSITEHNYRSTKNYDQYLEDWLGITALNYGVSSSAYTDNEAGAGWYTKLLANTYPTEVDGIIIMGALNDRHNPVGVYGDNTTATLYGTLKLFYEELISRYPNVPIVTITSTPRDYSYGETATKSGYQNYHEWVDAVIKMSADYSIPCLDLYRLSGLRPWNTTNNLTYFSCASAPNGDGVHPNALGHEIMASKIYDFVIQHMYK